MREPYATTPTVTVLMPVYNGAAFLRAAIDSVIGQSRADWELVAPRRFSLVVFRFNGSDEDNERLLERGAYFDAVRRVSERHGDVAEPRFVADAVDGAAAGALEELRLAPREE